MLTTIPTRPQDRPQNIPKPYSKTAAKELRRNRGEIACAECRRLKVRCNRQVPCATCIARGCSALCPNGTLPPGDNSRFVISATDHLQRKIGKMEERMRALEDALAIAQATESSLPHPLLTEEAKLDSIEFQSLEEDSEEDRVESVAESFGTLHINEKERTVRFFGPSGGSESLLITESSDEHRSPPGTHEGIGPIDLRALGLPSELDTFFYSFPLTPLGLPTSNVCNIIYSYLPSWDRADQLCRCMLDSMSWMFHVVSFRQLAQELMPHIYFRDQKDQEHDTSPYRGLHGVALFFIVLAIGSLVDLSRPPYNQDAQRYYVMATVALTLEPMAVKVSLSTVKALHLISIYCGMSGSEKNMPNQYAILTLACRLAQKIGLHVDPVHWRMEEKDVYDRRCCYWELLLADLWQSIYSGRPPALAGTNGDCKVPTPEDEEKFQQDEYTIGFGIWGFLYSQSCLVPVNKLVVEAKSPTYPAVLELDRKIQLFKPPPSEEYPDSPSVAMSMRWYGRSHYKELILLALHRSFFAQAIASHPNNPLDSPYKQSFVTAYKSACRVLSATSEQFARRPQLLSRVWMIWSFNFSSAVIVGAVAARCKNLDISPPPLHALQDACTLFERASETNSRAAKALPVLLDMRDRAMRLHGNTGLPPSLPDSEVPRKGSANSDEVSILCGKPRLVESHVDSVAMLPDSLVNPPPGSHRNTLYPVSAPITPHMSQIPAPVPTYQSSDYHTHAQAQWSNAQQPGPSHAYYNYPPHYSTQPTDPRPHSVAHPVSHDTWNSPHPLERQYQYPSTTAGPTVDFNLEETWSNFLSEYGRL